MIITEIIHVGILLYYSCELILISLLFRNEEMQNKVIPLLAKTMKDEKEEFFWSNVSSFVQESSTVKDLQCVEMTGWSLIQKANFDCFYNDQPYTLVCVLLCEGNGQYHVRAWNQTIEQGILTNICDLEDLLLKTFQTIIPCLGNQDQQIKEALKHPQIKLKNCELIFAPKKNNSRCCLSCQLQTEENSRRKGYFNSDKLSDDDLHGSKLLPATTDHVNAENCPTEYILNSEKATTDPNPLQCRECHLIFGTRSIRLQHERQKHAFGRFTCSSCQTTLYKLPDYILHLVEHHPDTMVVPCTMCKVDQTVGSEYIKHYKECYRRGRHRQSHRVSKEKAKIKLRSPTENEYFASHYCNFQSNWENSLQKHTETKHQEEEIVKGEDESVQKSLEVNLEYESKASLQQNVDSKDDTYYYDSQSSKVKPVIHPCRCRECDQELTSPTLRIKHEKFVHGYGRFKCVHCPLRMWKLSDHIFHTIHRHPDVKELSCVVCNRTFDIDYDHFGHFKECCTLKKLEIANTCQEKIKKRKELEGKSTRKEAAVTYKTFACQECNFTSKWEGSLRRHIETKHRVGKSQDCHIQDETRDIDCTISEDEEVMESADDDPITYYKVIPVLDPLQCRECKLMLDTKCLRIKHEKLSHGYGRFNCQHCSVRTWKLDHYLAHTTERHSGVNTVSCPMCKFSFNINEYNLEHFKECHQLKKVEMLSKYKFKAKRKYQEETEGSSQPEAKQKKKSGFTRGENDGDENNEQLQLLFEESEPYEMKKEKREKIAKWYKPKEARENPLECRECKLTFMSKAVCSGHEKKVHAFGTFRCNHCVIKSWKLDDHIEHMSSCHPEFKAEPCALCKEEQEVSNKYFDHYIQCYLKDRKRQRDEIRMRTKEKLMATDTKRFSCHLCPFQTNYPDSMQNHENKHKRETCDPDEASKFYNHCDQCGKGFATRNYLKCHIRDVHKINWKKFQCDECDESFVRSPQLKKHKQFKHSDDPRLNCTICGERRRTIHDLKLHMNTHTGDDKVICKDCGVSVTQSKLKNHMRIHTGEKPFACQICDMRFMSSSTRSGHLRQKHNTSVSELNKMKQAAEEA